MNPLRRLLSPGPYFRMLANLSRVILGHRQLAWALAKRDITDRYVNQMLGTAWAVLHPLIFVLIYIFLFVFVFKARIGDRPGLPDDFALYIMAGLIPWLALQDALTRGVLALSSNASLVKQVVFPLELLPCKIAVSALFPMFCGLGGLLAYILVRHRALPWSLALLPPAVGLQVALTLGLNLLLAPLGCYLRDLKDLLQVALFVLMYVTPLFYLPDMAPAVFRPFLTANPFSHLVICYQDVFFFQSLAHPWSWAVAAGFSFLALLLGGRVFTYVKPHVGNVL